MEETNRMLNVLDWFETIMRLTGKYGIESDYPDEFYKAWEVIDAERDYLTTKMAAE